MHIAICDDNIADRKQLERLLGRESDARKADSGVFYTDSFGQGDKLYSSRMSYDLFFIDVTGSDETGFFLANRLIKGGVTAPVVLCSSTIDYKEEALKMTELPGNLRFLNKPVLKDRLAEILDEAILEVGRKEPTIELRDQQDTFYVREDEILYAESEGQYLKVLLKDGRVASVFQDAYTFYMNHREFTHYVLTGPHVMVNAAYIGRLSRFKAVMTDGKEFRILPVVYGRLKKAMERAESEKKEGPETAGPEEP
ncbi:MAG: hypothetical protein K6F53_10920 [Lachnospiraceae bacterium]|nr:hypothetical protein [Lachnospiraceae bacterium]